MPKAIDVPGTGIVEFPDSMPDDEISGVLKKRAGPAAPIIDVTQVRPGKAPATLENIIGQTASEAYRKLDPEAQRQIKNAAATVAAVPQVVGSTAKSLGELGVGTLADLGSNIVEPGQGYHTENMQAALRNAPGIELTGAQREELPTYGEVRQLPTALRIPASAAQGFIESAPKLAAVVAQEAMGVPAPLAAAISFGTTEHGFDPKQAVVAAALPFLGKYSGEIGGAIAKRFGVDNSTALNWIKGVSGTAGPAAALIADQEAEISQLPKDQQHEARINMWSGIAGQVALGPMGVKFEKPAVNAKFPATWREIQPTPVQGPRGFVPERKAVKPIETPKGEPNASQVSKAAEVHGNVQPQPIEGAGKVPVEKGVPGVQPQAAGGIQKVEGAGPVPIDPSPEQLAKYKPTSGKVSWTPDYFKEAGNNVYNPDWWVEAFNKIGDPKYDGTGTSYQIGKFIRSLGEENGNRVIDALEGAREKMVSEMKNAFSETATPEQRERGMRFGTGAVQYPREAWEAAMGELSAKGEISGEPIKRVKKQAPEPEPTVESVTPLEPQSGRELTAEEMAAPKPQFAPSLAEKPVKEFNLDEPVEEPKPQPVGMGAMAAGELAPSPKTPTGIKNAQVDVERQQRGLPPAIQPARRSFGKVWDEAMARIDSDPAYPDRLIGELRDKPRALTDAEDATLLHRQIDLQNEYGKATRDLAKAYDDGRMDDVGNEQARVSALSDQLLDLYNIGKKVGTETGRGLNARKLMAYEDFTLAKMEMEARVAKGGRPLTDTERSQVTALNKKIETTQRAFDEYVAKTDRDLAARDMQAALNDMQRDLPAGKGPRLKPEDFEGQKAEVKQKIKLRLDEGERSDISSLVQRLARLFVQQGVRERDPLIDAVHGVLKEIDPEFTRRETMDAISGYGDFKQLTKDEISVKLRDLKGQMQQVAKLEDMQANRPPLKTGLERRIPSTEESRLIRLVNEAKRQFQIPITDEATQLKSSLDMLKTRLKRKTAEWEDRLKRGDFSKKPKRVIQMDAEANRLHFENAQAKAKWHEALMKDRLANRSLPKKIFSGIGEVVNTFRSIMTGLDLSAVLRQGGFITFGHPIRSLQAFPAMFRALRSEAGQHAVNREIMARKNYPLYQQSKLYLSEHGQKLSQMEEAYMSRWADKIPLLAASQRAYTTFLNKLRADSFDIMANSLGRSGELTAAEGKAIANYINVATGRGNLGMQENALVGLNTLFFSPRYVASRFQLALGQPLYQGTARTRIAVAKEYGRFLIGLGVVYGLGGMAGATLETDPRSADFGKLKFGNTRVDPLAGLAQVTTLLGRMAEGETKTGRGQVIPIRGPRVPFGGANAADVLARFLRSKLSPAAGTIVNVLAGKDVMGQPVTPASTAKNLLVPLAFNDIYNATKEQGVPAGIALGLLALFGMNVQTYKSQ